MNKPTEIVSWTGRREPVSGTRKTTYTVGKKRFDDIEDARKAKRSANFDLYPNKPLPNIFKGPVPTMQTVLPELQKKQQGWRQSHKQKNTSNKRKASSQGPLINEGPVPVMDTIIPKLRRKGWGGKSHKKKGKLSKKNKTQKKKVINTIVIFV